MYGPRDRRQWAAFKEIQMVCNCWFMHDGKKREERVWSGLEDHKWKVGKRREQDAYSSFLSIPSPTSSTWPVCKEIKLYPKMNGPDCFIYLGEGFFTCFFQLSSQGHSLGSKSKAAFKLSSLLTGCLWQENSASGPLLNGECQP